MEAAFVLIIWILMMFFSIRDIYLAYFKPKDFIQVIRNRRHRYLIYFHFLETLFLIQTRILFCKAIKLCCLSQLYF